MNPSNFKISSILFGQIIQIARMMTRWEGEGFGRESEVAFISLFECCDNILSENNRYWQLYCINSSYELRVPTVLTWESSQFPTSVITRFFHSTPDENQFMTSISSCEELLAWYFVRNHFCKALPLYFHHTTSRFNESPLMYESNMESSATISGIRDMGSGVVWNHNSRPA